jgi:hypothetical protein
MAARLKGVILSVEDVILNKGTIDKQVFEQVDLLMKFFKLRDIKPVLLANTRWEFTSNETGQVRILFDVLKEHYPELEVFSRHFDSNVQPKPRAAATEYVRRKMGWATNETLYIGSTETDMQTAVNGNLLFLCSTWYNDNTNYGFKFSQPKQMARFIDTLCLREHFWSHEIKDGKFEFYALAPFSTMRPDYARYSEDARSAAKHGLGHPDFWLSALVTSMYFTGLHERIDFIAAYPGHEAGVGNNKMNNDLMTFAKCFRKGYLHDVIERHTTALKSQTARNQGKQLDHLNQLNTIKLNPLPTKNYNAVYKNNPLKAGKTVLLVDDICTRGFSLESARKYIERTNANVIMVSWLKTINTDFSALGDLGNFNPYVSNNFTAVPLSRSYGYHADLVNPQASDELGDQLRDFIKWDWPKEII